MYLLTVLLILVSVGLWLHGFLAIAALVALAGYLTFLLGEISHLE